MKFKRVAIIGTNYPELETFCPHWQGIKIGLSRLPLEYIFLSCRPELDIEALVKFNPDLIVYGLKDMVVRRDWRKKIAGRLPNAIKVIWYGDFRNEETGQIFADCSEVSAMFVSNDAQKDFYKIRWKVPKVHFLPLGSEPIDKPKMNKKYAFDFVFVGSQITEGAFHHRASQISTFKLRASLTLVNSYDPKMRANIFRAMPDIYSSSKICLDMSHFTDVSKYTSIRYWEIAAFWGFALTKRFPGCEEFYPEDTRAYFDTFDEAVAKKEYYLKHEDERSNMLNKAHELSYNHTYTQRFLTMFSLL